MIIINNYSIEECTYGGRVGPRVGSDFLTEIAGRVGSGQVNVSPGRVKKSDPWTTLILPDELCGVHAFRSVLSIINVNLIVQLFLLYLVSNFHVTIIP